MIRQGSECGPSSSLGALLEAFRLLPQPAEPNLARRAGHAAPCEYAVYTTTHPTCFLAVTSPTSFDGMCCLNLVGLVCHHVNHITSRKTRMERTFRTQGWFGATPLPDVHSRRVGCPIVVHHLTWANARPYNCHGGRIPPFLPVLPAYRGEA